MGGGGKMRDLLCVHVMIAFDQQFAPAMYTNTHAHPSEIYKFHILSVFCLTSVVQDLTKMWNSRITDLHTCAHD